MLVLNKEDSNGLHCLHRQRNSWHCAGDESMSRQISAKRRARSKRVVRLSLRFLPRMQPNWQVCTPFMFPSKAIESSSLLTIKVSRSFPISQEFLGVFLTILFAQPLSAPSLFQAHLGSHERKSKSFSPAIL